MGWVRKNVETFFVEKGLLTETFVSVEVGF